MATSYTSLLGFALPVTGELNGTWGDVVNNSITQLVEDSVAGQATASVASGDWTLTTTGSGAANQARCAILIPTGSPGVSRNIIAPSSSKAYVVINQSNAAVVLKGSATTGVTIPTGKKMLCAWNGSDFVQIGESGTVTAVSVATANGLAGTSSGGATPALTLSTTVSGIVKGNGTALSAAVSGTDYAPATSGSAILKGNGAGGFSSAVSGTDYAPATSGAAILYGNSAGGFSNVTIGSGVSFAGGTLSATGTGGTVTSVSGTSPVASSGGTTPAISLSSGYGDTQNPYASKTANYVLAAPNGVAGVPTFRAIVAADIPTLNQNTTGSAAKWTTARTLAGNSVDGSANVAFSNKFIAQGTTDAGLSGAQFLGALGTGLVKNTTTTGVLSIATSGTDYAPATSGSSILYGNGAGGFSNVTIGSGISFAGGTLSATGTGTVTSVGMTTPTGLTVTGSPITTSGTLALTLTSGYSIPTTASQTNWDSAYTQRLQWDGSATNLVAATGRTSLGLVIGTNVQAYSANLTSWAAKTVPTGTVVGDTDTQTLTNKRITPRVVTTTASATPSINSDTTDMYGLTALNTNITSVTVTGTPTNGQKLWVYMVSTSVSRSITWGSSFEASTIALPTTTSGSNRLDVGFVWNSVTSKWRCVAVA